MTNSRISSYFFFILLLGTVVAAIMLFLPFLTPLVLAAAASVMAYPLYTWILKTSGDSAWRRNLAAFLTVVIILVVIIVPLFFLISSIYSEIQDLYGVLTDESGRSQVISALNNFSQSLSNALFNAFPAYSFDSLNVTEYLKSALVWIFGNLDTIFKGFASVAAYVFVFLISMFYFLRDGMKMKKRFVAWSPLIDEQDEQITATLKRAVRSVFAGTVAVSIIQGILTGFGFWIFGIPAPAVWGSAAAVAAMVPGLGTSLVLVPGVIYLFVSGNTANGIGLLIWGVFAVGLIDNLLGPYLMNRGINIHSFLILISVLGGLVTFGVVGFLLGPLILAFLVALLDIYRSSFAKKFAQN